MYKYGASQIADVLLYRWRTVWTLLLLSGEHEKKKLGFETSSTGEKKRSRGAILLWVILCSQSIKLSSGRPQSAIQNTKKNEKNPRIKPIASKFINENPVLSTSLTMCSDQQKWIGGT